MQDTIVALSSGRPPAAIAVIRTSGPQAFLAAELLAGTLPIAREASLRTLRHPATRLELDSALILTFVAPNSATGEDIVEYQCHGGRAVVAAILDALTSVPGLRLAAPGEFTRRALASGRLDLTEAEGLADLLEAETESQRRAALALAGGALSRQVETWQSRVLNLSARAEAAIDYVGDEDETSTDTRALRAEALKFAGELDAWLALPRVERLRDGLRVVVSGPPNSGKSSLVNALAGSDRAIVTTIPGTTRDSIEVPLSVDGIPLVLVDTAGLRDTADPVEAIGVARARSEADRAEILLWLGDPADAKARVEVIRVHSKSDIAQADMRADANVSAVTGEGVGALLAMIGARAAALLPTEGDVALNRRQAAILREAAQLLSDAPPGDLVLLAETLRQTRATFDRLTGRAGVEEAIDALFTRFCLGK
ncbi:MAG: tRNA uridine-5-carboxymethylaminomethyl(34) synthesis GTPase MnmE [Sphingomicrobium sp.]